MLLASAFFAIAASTAAAAELGVALRMAGGDRCGIDDDFHAAAFRRAVEHDLAGAFQKRAARNRQSTAVRHLEARESVRGVGGVGFRRGDRGHCARQGGVAPANQCACNIPTPILHVFCNVILTCIWFQVISSAGTRWWDQQASPEEHDHDDKLQRDVHIGVESV